MQTILRIVSGLITVYVIVIVIRIMLTWFGNVDLGRVGEILNRITDPYLNFFRRFVRFQIGGLDFSPVIAILALTVVSNIVSSIAAVGVISLGIILAIVLSALASAFGFFLILFLVLTVIRLIGYFANVNTSSRGWITLDHILEPIVYKFTNVFLRGNMPTYRNSMLLFAGVNLVVLIAGNLLVNLALRALVRLPI